MAARSKKGLGVLFILLPFILIGVALFGYALVHTLLASIPEGSSETLKIVLSYALSFLGFVGVLGFFVFIPLGIYFLARKEPVDPTFKADPRSGKGDASEIPDELKGGWNWGAAGLTWIWGLPHGVWLSLLDWISPINLFWWAVLGHYGNEWAWRARPWASVEEFKASQNKWKFWGILFLILRLAFFALVFSPWVFLGGIQG